jgi:hypothetical protein
MQFRCCFNYTGGVKRAQQGENFVQLISGGGVSYTQALA